MRGKNSRMKAFLLCVGCPALLFMAGRNIVEARAGSARANDASAPMTPQLFQDGIISTEDDEVNGSFSPDGTEYYFSKLNQYTTGPELGIICVSHLKNGKWSEPEALPFSGLYLDFGPRLSPDGRAMYFSSSRTVPGRREGSIAIWKSSRVETGWSDQKIA
jgi:WD40-like Beta Propeller Repeat